MRRDPVTLFMIPGFLEGLVIAVLFHRLQRSRPSQAGIDPLAHEPVTTDPINMARIRVAGVGGLGFVAMAIAVAFMLPRVGESLAIGLVSGALFAVVLILVRGRHP